MYNTESPSLNDLPSSRALLRSTVIAAGVALLLLVLVVLPAEYGVDATGMGRLLGLTRMGEIKRELAAQEGDAAPSPTTASSPAATVSSPAPSDTVRGVSRTDTVRVTIQPGKGREIKLEMAEGATVNFRWTTDGAVVNYDMHADRHAEPAIKYHGYKKGQGVSSDEGVLTAAFGGMHGWFWRNRTSAPVTVTLVANGAYSAWKEIE
jgi:hypothetical protein